MCVFRRDGVQLQAWPLIVIAFDHKERDGQAGETLLEMLVSVRPPIIDTVIAQNNQQIIFAGVPPKAELFNILIITVAVARNKHMGHIDHRIGQTEDASTIS